MELMDKIIERVQFILGETYYIRYEYRMYEECYIVRTIRSDCDIDFNIKLHKDALDVGISKLSIIIAQRIISGFTDIFENYDKYKNEE